VWAGGKRGRALTRVRAAQTRDGVGMCIVCRHALLSVFPPFVFIHACHVACGAGDPTKLNPTQR